ncbi:MAG: 4-hydroxythreonine-4-phosphate dehydrogenase PdxA [Candidatus Marinimicrobia bacterium]|nr:4-hydroxythreonine-4-phosphate dehydrogenase PdxA [Candidatus Neomarinimicrobiota bacterium]
MRKPVIGITMGDPAGIGPEITLKALQNKEVMKICNPVVIGSFTLLQQELQNPLIKLHKISKVEEADFAWDTINILDPVNENFDLNIKGKISARAGKAAFHYIKTAIELALEKKLDSVATGPIHKEAIKAAKLDFIGHTEMFGQLTGSHDPLTVFEVHNLRIFFLSRHVSLRQCCDLVTKTRVLDYIERSITALTSLGLGKGTFAVAGLNPHSSDNGLFGHEEQDEIIPAIEAAKAMGYKVIGPIGADSVFHLAMKNNWDGVLSLYHDQGHIAAKTLDFDRTISLTLGLPFLRTSVDHGTAFDIAGKGLAQCISMEEAIRKAVQYTRVSN